MRTIHHKLQLSRCGNGSPLLASDPSALSGVQPNDILGVGSLVDLLISLGEHELYVAGVGHVWVDLGNNVRLSPYGIHLWSWLTHPTVRTVCPPPLLWGLVDLDVGNGEVGNVETLDVSVGLGVLEEVQKESGGLDGPAGTGDTELLSCSNQNLLINFLLLESCICGRVD